MCIFSLLIWGYFLNKSKQIKNFYLIREPHLSKLSKPPKVIEEYPNEVLKKQKKKFSNKNNDQKIFTL